MDFNKTAIEIVNELDSEDNKNEKKIKIKNILEKFETEDLKTIDKPVQIVDNRPLKNLKSITLNEIELEFDLAPTSTSKTITKRTILTDAKDSTVKEVLRNVMSSKYPNIGSISNINYLAGWMTNAVINSLRAKNFCAFVKGSGFKTKINVGL